MKDWVEKYNEIADKFNEFGKSLNDKGFRKIAQASENFALMCIKLCCEDAKAIALLLKNGYYCEAMMILRSSIELLFKIHWVHDGDGYEEQNERTYKLEGKPFSDIQKEIDYLRRRLTEEGAVNNSDFVDKFQEAMNKHKENYPYLVQDNDKFKISPNNVDMAGDNIRQRFYQDYRYLCMFSHPTPMLTDMLLSDDSGESVFRESIEQALNNGIPAYQFIMGFCFNILSKHVPKTHDVRERLYNEMKELAK